MSINIINIVQIEKMSGPGNLVTKNSRHKYSDPPSGDKVLRHMDKSLWHKYSVKPPQSRLKNLGSNRLEEQVDSKASAYHSKKSQVSTANYDETAGKENETDPFDSIGATLSDEIKSMKMFPVLSSYQEIDKNNRSYLWNEYLKDLDGGYVIIDKVEKDQEGPIEIYDKNIIRKIEISTLISSDSELYATQLDLPNQHVLSLDIDRTRNSIKEYKAKAEKIMTLFCKSHNITYKQGMNEVVSLFLL